MITKPSQTHYYFHREDFKCSSDLALYSGEILAILTLAVVIFLILSRLLSI